ncbi:MAG: hypothetical protein JWO91_190 [Acidobacteriaceae bacterium]|jgi:hypothetical protein|nr:hypothetical protein [Acidobacteriaceae bacterium]
MSNGAQQMHEQLGTGGITSSIKTILVSVTGTGLPLSLSRTRNSKRGKSTSRSIKGDTGVEDRIEIVSRRIVNV